MAHQVATGPAMGRLDGPLQLLVGEPQQDLVGSPPVSLIFEERQRIGVHPGIVPTADTIATASRYGEPMTPPRPAPPEPPPARPDPTPVPTLLPPPPQAVHAERIASVPGPTPVDQRRTGVVWVHGIGTQQPRDSLFDWTRPIIDVFTEWRRQYDRDHPEATIGENPVGSASVSDPANAWIELDIPAYADRERAQWLFTEAYWAADVRPPSFGAASSYLLGRLPGIVKGIALGYGERERRRGVRLKRLHHDHLGDPRLAELDLALSGRWQITDRLDELWQARPIRLVLMLIASGLGVVALGIYSLLHAIPIPPIQKRLEIAAADTFIVEWFGDLAVILDDQAQAAAIRTRLLERVRWLREQHCEDIVLLAHSGGTVVSYATLLRYPTADFDVAKLITLGEAIKLAWRLEQETGDWDPGNSFRGDLKATHPHLRWVDIWASYDPAPSGAMAEADGCPLVLVDKLGQRPRDPRMHVESRPVTNFMHLAQDHGGYWSNDEGFLIPVIRHIDDPRGNGDGSRFFSDALDRTLRTERRRRRVALLLVWRWTGFAAAAAAVAGLIAGVPDARATGDSFAGVWTLLPGHELVSGAVDGIGGAISVVLRAVGATSLVDAAGSAGPSLLGALVPIAAVAAIYLRGVGSWYAHDALERKAIRGERLGPAGLPSARSEAFLVIGGLIAVIVASWTASGVIVAMLIVATAVAAGIVRLAGRQPAHAASAARVAEMTSRRS